MNKIIYIILLISFLFGGICCKPELIIIEPTNTDSVYAMTPIWKTAIYDDSAGASHEYPVLTDDYFIISTNLLYSANDGVNGIGVYDRVTGERHPAWQDEPNLNIEYTGWDIAGVNQDVVVFASGKKLSAYSLTTAQLLWVRDVVGNERYVKKISTYNNIVFITSGYSGQLGKLLAINAYTGEEEVVFSCNIIDNYEISLNPPQVYIEPNGDTLLLFQSRQYNFYLPDGKVVLYAYNMTQDSLKWMIDDVTIDGSSSVQKSIVNGDFFYFQGSNSVHCIDIQTGQIVWDKYTAPSSFWQAQNLYVNGKLYLLSAGGKVFCLNALTGAQLWTKDCDACPKAFGQVIACYDNKLYLNTISTGDYMDPLGKTFRCLDATNGKVLWSSDIDVPHYGMIVDEHEGVMYGASSRYAYKIDLNNSPILVPEN